MPAATVLRSRHLVTCRQATSCQQIAPAIRLPGELAEPFPGHRAQSADLGIPSHARGAAGRKRHLERPRTIRRRLDHDLVPHDAIDEVVCV